VDDRGDTNDPARDFDAFSAAGAGRVLGTAQRRWGAILGALAVVTVATGVAIATGVVPGHLRAAGPPATSATPRAPAATSPSVSSSATDDWEFDGDDGWHVGPHIDSGLITSTAAVLPELFLAPEAFTDLGLGEGRQWAWIGEIEEDFQVHVCDPMEEAEFHRLPWGGVGFGPRPDYPDEDRHGSGVQKVGTAADRPEAGQSFQKAVRDLRTCRGRAKDGWSVPGYRQVRVTSYNGATTDWPAGRPAVFKVDYARAEGAKHRVQWVTLGYTVGGDYTVIMVKEAPNLDEDTVRALGQAALDRMASTPWPPVPASR
jgi:hypothetical protein